MGTTLCTLGLPESPAEQLHKIPAGMRFSNHHALPFDLGGPDVHALQRLGFPRNQPARSPIVVLLVELPEADRSTDRRPRGRLGPGIEGQPNEVARRRAPVRGRPT